MTSCDLHGQQNCTMKYENNNYILNVVLLVVVTRAGCHSYISYYILESSQLPHQRKFKTRKGCGYPAVDKPLTALLLCSLTLGKAMPW